MKRTLFALLVISMLVFGAQAAFGLPEIPSTAFQASSGCGCHAGLLQEWRPSMHAQALTDPLYRVKLDEANAATDGALGPFCEACHAPIAIMAGELPGMEVSELPEVSAEGVTCDFCHQVTGTDGPIGNTSTAVDANGVKRAQFDDSVSPGHESEYSAFHETAEFCGNCHNVDHPGNGMHLEATYTEWKEGPYAAQGIVCQDCHMTPGPGVIKPNPGKAAGMGPEREHIYTMTFAGGNVALGDADLAEARLQAAAALDLVVPEVVSAGETVDVATTITNVGAGHYLPTGLTEVRQMWLEVVATAPDGTELLNERRDFGTVLKDAEGNYPVELWEAVDIQSDDRIPPQESTSNEYTFVMPAEGGVTVSAALYYRSAPEEMAEKAGVDVPTTTMVSAESNVFTTEAERIASVNAIDEDPLSDEGGSGWMIAFVIVLVVAVAGLLIWRARSQA